MIVNELVSDVQCDDHVQCDDEGNDGDDNGDDDNDIAEGEGSTPL
jgi:hypothetical protein